VTFGGAPGSPAPLSDPQLRAIKSLFKKLKKQDDIKLETAKAKNDLEQYIYDTRNQLEEQEAQDVSTAEQREELQNALGEAESWLHDVSPDDENAAIFKDKLASVRRLADPIFIRRLEAGRREGDVKATRELIQYTRELVADLTKQRPWIPEEDKESLLKMAKEAEEWLDAKLIEQEAKKLWEDPAFVSKDLRSKIEPIAKYSAQLLKRPKPKEPAKSKKKAASTSEESEKTSQEDAKETSAGKSPPTEDETGTSTNDKNADNADSANNGVKRDSGTEEPENVESMDESSQEERSQGGAQDKADPPHDEL